MILLDYYLGLLTMTIPVLATLEAMSVGSVTCAALDTWFKFWALLYGVSVKDVTNLNPI